MSITGFMEGQVFYIQVLVRGEILNHYTRVSPCLTVQANSLDEPIKTSDIRGRTLLNTLLYEITEAQLKAEHPDLHIMLEISMTTMGGKFIELPWPRRIAA